MSVSSITESVSSDFSSSEYSDDSSISDPLGLEKEDLLARKDDLSKEIGSLEISKIPADLSYNVLLEKAFALLQDSNTDIKTLSIPLVYKRVPGGMTSINLYEISEYIDRNPKHLMNYIFEVLSTQGSVNKSGVLIIKGNFTKQRILYVLRLFVTNFVFCKTCSAVLNTCIVKENRLYFLKCKNCGSSSCIGQIKDGYYNK